MTIDELKAMSKEYLTPKEVSCVTGWSEDTVRYYARTKQFDFPVIAPDKPGARVKISRIGFINFWAGLRPEPQKTLTDELLEKLVELETERNELIRALIERRMTA